MNSELTQEDLLAIAFRIEELTRELEENRDTQSKLLSDLLTLTLEYRKLGYTGCEL